MEHFAYINHFDVREAIAQVDAHSELWNQHPERTAHDTFAGTSDIWLRFRAPEELTAPWRFGEPHFPIFYPAWEQLPALKPIVRQLLTDVAATHLGGIMLTRIPPGGWVKPHHDRGGWHAEFYTMKVYIPLRTNASCLNRCEQEVMVMQEGEAWYFNNLVEHEVMNPGETERITLIVCMRTEGLA